MTDLLGCVEQVARGPGGRARSGLPQEKCSHAACGETPSAWPIDSRLIACWRSASTLARNTARLPSTIQFDIAHCFPPCELSMMPLHVPTQASHMNTAGPASSFDASRSVLPQNEQHRRRFGEIPMRFKTLIACTSVLPIRHVRQAFPNKR